MLHGIRREGKTGESKFIIFEVFDERNERGAYELNMCMNCGGTQPAPLMKP